jgi:hypothetical protein
LDEKPENPSDWNHFATDLAAGLAKPMIAAGPRCWLANLLTSLRSTEI